MSRRGTCLMGIDSGTQSTTVCVYSATGRRLARASAPNAVRTPRPGWAEQDARSWWSSTRSAIRGALEQVPARRIAAVGLAYQRETFALLDGRGRPVRPGILWLDVRADEEVEQIAREIGPGRYHRRTGKPLDVTSAAARLLWLRRHERAALAAAKTWMDVGGYLAGKLTGRWATCVAGADTCGLVDLHKRDWIDDYVAPAGLKRGHLPELVEPGAVIAGICRAAARQTGLSEGLPVIAAGGDGQVFNVGMNAAGAYETSLTLGTSIVLGVSCPKAPISPLFRTLLSASGGYLLESVLQAGTYLLRWFVEQFGGTESSWDRQIARIPPGCEGLVTLPNFWGIRFPKALPDARGATLGWSNHHTPAHFYRSLLEGLSFELRRLLTAYRAMFPRQLRRAIHVGGGGTRSRHWRGILADVTGSAIRPAREDEAVALGAAVLAGVGIGRFADARRGAAAMVRLREPVAPDRGRGRLYGRLYADVYARLLEATADVSAALRRLCAKA